MEAPAAHHARHSPRLLGQARARGEDSRRGVVRVRRAGSARGKAVQRALSAAHRRHQRHLLDGVRPPLRIQRRKIRALPSPFLREHSELQRRRVGVDDDAVFALPTGRSVQISKHRA